MCGNKRRTAPMPDVMTYQDYGYAPRGHCNHGCGPRRGGHGPVGGLIGVAANALTNTASPPANLRDGQVTGVTSGNVLQNVPPPYAGPKNVRFENEKEVLSNVDRIEQPPAYTPHAPVIADHLDTTPHKIAEIPRQAQRLAQHPGFAAFPALQSPNPAISADLHRLGDALASMQLGEQGSKHAARKAKKQLVRDLWTEEEMKRGPRCAMSCGERKMVKAQMKAVKGALKAEMRSAYAN